MKILADENIPQSVIRKLQKEGFDVFDIKRKGKRLSDLEIIFAAKKENRIIITFDNDFLGLIKIPEYKTRIILLKTAPQTKSNINKLLQFLIQSGLITNFNQSAIVSLVNDPINVSYIV